MSTADPLTSLPVSRREPNSLAINVDAAGLIALHDSWPERYPVLLESAMGDADGHDILMAFPAEELLLEAPGRLSGPGVVGSEHHFLEALDRWWARDRLPSPHAADLPFRGGWFLYLSYELANEIEPKLRLPVDPGACIARAVRIPAAIVRRHSEHRAWIIAEAGREDLLRQIALDLQQCAAPRVSSTSLVEGSIVEDPPEIYLDAVGSALEHIAAGEIYQANLSRSWRARVGLKARPVDIYRRLRATNPAPFAALSVFGEHGIVSSSPERLLELRNGYASTRPIAGTRPRALDDSSDRELAAELKGHPKERAEHIMLIDLERNDLGKICERGTVEVDEYMSIESYAHVHHIVSNVRGQLRAEVTPGKAIAAMFPGGTITGCPKVRCMELIASMEQAPRGAYTGSIGYLNHDGSLDLNILIRTLEIRGRDLRFRAGAGIVADSDPERELEETRAKARGVLQAIQDVSAS